MSIEDKKEDKRRRILQSAQGLFLERGIRNVSIKEIAKEANVGLGTIYLYFKNKDMLLFEIFKAISHSQFEKVRNEMPKGADLKDKFLSLFSYYFDGDENGFIHLFADFYTICIHSNYINKEKKEFMRVDYNELFDFIEEILNDAVKSKEIKNTDSNKLAKAMCASIDGMFFYSIMVEGFDLEYEVNKYLDTMIGALKN